MEVIEHGVERGLSHGQDAVSLLGECFDDFVAIHLGAFEKFKDSHGPGIRTSKESGYYVEAEDGPARLKY